MAAFDRAARRHRGDGGGIASTRERFGNEAGPSRSEHLCVATASRCRATFAELDWGTQFLRQLQSHRVSAVLDVGANWCSTPGVAARPVSIVSFERCPGPLPQRSAHGPVVGMPALRWAMVDGTGLSTSPANEAPAVRLADAETTSDAFPPANYGLNAADTRFDSAAAQTSSAAQRYCAF